MGKSIGEVQKFSAEELEVWRQYFVLYPFDDHHRYHRPAAVIAASMGGEYQKHLDFLSPPAYGDQYSDADIRTMRAFGIDPSMRP